MKRFLTVSEKDAEVVVELIRNAVIMNVTNDVYHWIKKQLQDNRVPHNDQNANHHNDLPHQGGFASFYIDHTGQWMKVHH
jgi:hypothetical protein